VKNGTRLLIGVRIPPRDLPLSYHTIERDCTMGCASFDAAPGFGFLQRSRTARPIDLQIA